MQFTKLKTWSPIVICIACWFYRFKKLALVLKSGILVDFNSYFQEASIILAKKTPELKLGQSTFGPPTTYLPFLPFALFPIETAQYLITGLNLLSLFFVFYLLYKKFFRRVDSFFWLFISSLAFCFPLIFSLAQGNPLGQVTLGIYAFWLFPRQRILSFGLFFVAGLLKQFPFILLPIRLIKKHTKNKNAVAKTDLTVFLLYFLLTAFLSIIFLPSSIWRKYHEFGSALLKNLRIPDPTIYNQSLVSTLARFNLPISFHWPLYFGFALGIIFFTGYYFFKKNGGETSLDFEILALSAILLLHPFPWQYYFLILLPFLMLKIKENTTNIFLVWYCLAYFALSFNGGNIHISFLSPFLNSSQFLGTLILISAIFQQKSYSPTKNSVLQ